MNKTNFDILVENILNISEGRKPKTYAKMVIDFDRLENSVNSLSESNPFKKIYTMAIRGLKQYGEGDNDFLSNEEMSNEPKTLPEWEDALYSAFSGAALSKLEKKTFAERFFKYVQDPDREFMSEYVGQAEPEKAVESVSQHIYDYITQSDEESTSIEEVVAYIGRYGHDEAEVKEIIQKMVQDGQLSEIDGRLTALKDPSLDDMEPEESELTDNIDPDDLEGLRDDAGRDDSVVGDDDDNESVDSGRLPDDIARELGLNADDPFGDSDFYSDNEKSE